MAKTVYIDPQTMIKEQAELIADMAARQQGFDRKSPRWHKIVNQVLTERYTKSSTPFLDNPRTPIFDDAIFKHCKTFKLNPNIVKGAITALSQLYTEKIMGLKTGTNKDGTQGDFSLDDMTGLSNEKKEEIIHQKALNIYVRYFVCVAFQTLTDVLFETTKEDMIKNANATGYFTKNTKELRDPKTRDVYIELIYKGLKKFYESKGTPS